MLRRCAIFALVSILSLVGAGLGQIGSGEPPSVVTIRSITFDNKSEVPADLGEAAISHFVGTSLPKGAIKNLARRRVREFFREKGYFKAQISEPEVNSAGADPDHDYVVLAFHALAGHQYRLSKITILNAKVFRSDQLRTLVPLREGEIFDMSRMWKGVDSLRKFYGCEGYASASITPSMRVSDATRTLSLILDVTEGGRFRLAQIGILGLDEAAKRSLLLELQRLGASVGSVYSSCVFDHVQDGGIGAHGSFSFGSTLNGKTGLAYVVLDFRPNR